MNDNIVLSTNIGNGAGMRVLSDGSEGWIPAVLCYATSTTPGACTFQFVETTAGMPVAQQGTWNVGVTGPVAVTGTFFQATQPISGTVTATAGTNLNTSALALETGGNLAALSAKTPSLGQALAASSTPVVLTAIQVAALTPPTTLPAGTNLLGTISCSDETSTIYEGTTPLTPLFASFNLSASGPTTIVAAATGKKIRVLRYSLSFGSTVNCNLQSHTTTTTGTGIKYGIANATAGGAYCPVGIMQTVSGEALDGNLSGTGTVSGELTYVLA